MADGPLQMPPVPVPAWWRGRETEVQACLDGGVRRGSVVAVSASPPAILPTAYVPVATKQQIEAFARHGYARFEAAGIAQASVPAGADDGPPGAHAPSLNLTSMCYHTGAALPVTFESPQGLADGRVAFDYPAILRLHLMLFEAAADWLCPPVP